MHRFSDERNTIFVGRKRRFMARVFFEVKEHPKYTSVDFPNVLAKTCPMEEPLRKNVHASVDIHGQTDKQAPTPSPDRRSSPNRGRFRDTVLCTLGATSVHRSRRCARQLPPCTISPSTDTNPPASLLPPFSHPPKDILANLFKLQIGGQKHWNVYTHSFLQFGLNSARIRMHTKVADSAKAAEGSVTRSSSTRFPAGCFGVQCGNNLQLAHAAVLFQLVHFLVMLLPCLPDCMPIFLCYTSWSRCLH